jgi:pilus assembly protein CpaB
MKQKNVILMGVAVVCGLIAAFLTTQINAKGPKIEQVEVLVAKKDLAVGTQFTKAELPNLVTKKLVPKDALPANFVNDEIELLDKRLSQPVPADQVFSPNFLSNRGVIILPDGKDMVSLPMSPQDAAGGFVGPGAHVDVLAAMKVNNKLMAFPILVDMQILAVDTKTAYNNTGAFASMGMISLAVTQEQALLISLAKQRGCHLSLLLRNPEKPIDPTYDMKKIIKILQDDSPGGIYATEGTTPETRPGSVPRTDVIAPEGPPVAAVPPSTFNPATTTEPKPMETVKVEPKVETTVTTTNVPPKVEPPKIVTVKVFYAKADIAANTEITKDLIAQAFTTKEIPKENADILYAYSDLTPFLGQVFKAGVTKDQVVFKGMIGVQQTKVAPPEEMAIPKPDLTPEPKKEPKPVVVERKTYDVPWHTSNGTEIHRYEEYKPGEYRLQRILSPADANQDSRQPVVPDAQSSTPAAPNTQKPATENRKID